jgi:hypothetical protein
MTLYFYTDNMGRPPRKTQGAGHAIPSPPKPCSAASPSSLPDRADPAAPAFKANALATRGHSPPCGARDRRHRAALVAVIGSSPVRAAATTASVSRSSIGIFRRTWCQ